MVDILGIDIGNAFCSAVVFGRRFSSIYESSDIYVSKLDMSGFNKEFHRKMHGHLKYRVINEINNRLKEGVIEFDDMSVKTEDVYATIILSLLECLNSNNMILSFPNQYVDDISFMERLQKSLDNKKVNSHSINIIAAMPKAEAEMIGYVYSDRINVNKTALIYDLGYSVLDVSVVRYDKSVKMPELLIKDQVLPIGGKNFDDVIVNELRGQLNKQYRFIPKSDDEIAETRNAAVKIKHEPTEKTEYEDSLTIGNKCYEVSLSRERFEELSEDLLLQTVSKTCDIMDKAEQDNIKVDTFVLVGGSSRMPMVANMLRSVFGSSMVHVVDEPELVASYGAARYGESLFDLREKLDISRHAKVLVKPQKQPRAKWLTEYEERVKQRKDTINRIRNSEEKMKWEKERFFGELITTESYGTIEYGSKEWDQMKKEKAYRQRQEGLKEIEDRNKRTEEIRRKIKESEERMRWEKERF